MKRLGIVFLLLFAFGILLILPWACSRQRDFRDLPPTLIWERDQEIVSPAQGGENFWMGFTRQREALVSDGNMARLVIWQKSSREMPLTLTYDLRGAPLEMRLNWGEVRMLPPSSEWRRERLEGRLNAGLNFLVFEWTGKAQLRVRSLTVGETQGPTEELAPGDGVAVFEPAGAGTLRWSGRGALEIQVVEAKEGRLVSNSFVKRTGFLSRRLKQDFTFQGWGWVQAKVLSGQFAVSGYSFQPAPIPPSLASVRLANQPSIFIFLFDACRPSNLSAYGYHRRTSPNLDILAADGVVFENAYANASFTRSSVATLFTGLYPENHKVKILSHSLDKRLLLLPEYLKGKGYRTAIFSSAAAVSPAFGLDQGLDEYHAFFGSWQDRERTRIRQEKLVEWFSRPGPMFTYVHFMEPHLPIVPLSPFLNMFQPPGNRRHLIRDLKRLWQERHVFSPDEISNVVADYDSTIAYVDSQLGHILDSLRRQGLYDESLIIFLSDHGENLGEHGAWSHGNDVYEETTHVPLIVKFPASLGLSGRVDTVVELADVFPTVIDLFGQEIPLDGRSLMEAVARRSYDDRIVMARTFAKRDAFGMRWRDWFCVIDQKRNTEQLFHLAGDSQADVAAENPGLVRLFRYWYLRRLLRAAEDEGSAIEVDLKKLSPEEIENLKSLGYL
jgi:arylsulfatase A-like enzyme